MSLTLNRPGTLDHLLLSLLAAFGGRRFARQAHRHALRIYPDQQRARRRTRLLLRSLALLRSTRKWFSRLDEDALLRHWVRCHPELAEKPHRPYLQRGRSASDRVSLLEAHYRNCAAAGWDSIVETLCTGPLLLAGFVDRDTKPLELQLDRAGQFGKEGEFVLNLVENGERLYSAAFSFRSDGGERELFIGCLQGPACEKGRERVRSLTRACHGMRPRSLMLETMQWLAEQSGCTRLAATGTSGHIYQCLRKRRTIAFDYDACWREFGGEQRSGGDWLLPLHPEHKPLESVASRKRAEAARRNQLREEITEQARTHLAHPQAA